MDLETIRGLVKALRICLARTESAYYADGGSDSRNSIGSAEPPTSATAGASHANAGEKASKRPLKGL